MFHACMRILYHDWAGHSRKNGHSGTVCLRAGKTLTRYSKMQQFRHLFHNQKEWVFSIPERTFHFFHRVFHRFCEKEAQFPTRFSTFSTGFSTRELCFAYTRRNAARRFVPVSGKKSGHFAFYKKESRRFFFSFYSSLRLTLVLLSNLEKTGVKFSTLHCRRFFVWKKRGKLRFSTSAGSAKKPHHILCSGPLCTTRSGQKNPSDTAIGDD